MAKITPAQTRKIFAEAREKGLDKDTLDAFIEHMTGKASIRYLTIHEAIKVIDGLTAKKTPPRRAEAPYANGMITKKQHRYIMGMAKKLGWLDESGNPDEGSINTWLHNKFGISHITWLSSKKASDAIEGLKAMLDRKEQAAVAV